MFGLDVVVPHTRSYHNTETSYCDWNNNKTPPLSGLFAYYLSLRHSGLTTYLAGDTIPFDPDARINEDNYHITKGVAMLVALKSWTMPLEHRRALDPPIKYGNAGFIPPTFIASQEDASLLNDLDNHIKSNSAPGRDRWLAQAISRRGARASGISRLGLKSYDPHQGLLPSHYTDEDPTSLLCRTTTKMMRIQLAFAMAHGNTNWFLERFTSESLPKTRNYQHPYVQAKAQVSHVRKASSSWTATSVGKVPGESKEQISSAW
ncbi:hypothetical protein BDZ85DRAFT_97530 [Elsinoe ampelina]|uniref:Uncharacterized protein n=1 Tax=Elsinoe ampelina TaxID=302913 RepID=A0A6A6GF23_9PEZI|nr:hypothetical protein BDZ85DRAFT_97530 [Elsinoe ampelina]